MAGELEFPHNGAMQSGSLLRSLCLAALATGLLACACRCALGARKNMCIEDTDACLRLDKGAPWIKKKQKT